MLGKYGLDKNNFYFEQIYINQQKILIKNNIILFIHYFLKRRLNLKLQKN